MTADTNDIGVGYVRAQRDLSCVYTLGFYDPSLKYDRNRRLTLKIVGRHGLRAVYPEFYVVRSEEEKQTSLVKTAVLAPHMFESDEVRARLFVTGAQDGGWRTVAVAEVRLDPRTVEKPDEPWDLRGLSWGMALGLQLTLTCASQGWKRAHSPPTSIRLVTFRARSAYSLRNLGDASCPKGASTTGRRGSGGAGKNSVESVAF